MITRTPVGEPRLEADVAAAPPPSGVAALRAEWVVDGELVTGAFAWSSSCRVRRLREVDVTSRAIVGPALGKNVGWLLAGAGGLVGGVALAVVGERGDDRTEARATPAGLALGVLGGYALGASILALREPSAENASTHRETEALAQVALAPCGRAEDLGRLRLGLALGDGRVIEGTRGGQGTTGFVVPTAIAAERARVIVLDDPSRRLEPQTPVGDVDLASRALAPPAALRFSAGSPSASGGVSGVTLACGPPKPEVCGNGADDDCDGHYDVGCGHHSGSLEWTLSWSAPEDLDLTVTGPDGAEVSAAKRTGGASGLAMDRDGAGAFDRAHPEGPQLENVYLPAAIAPAPGTYSAVVEVARTTRSGAGLVEAWLTGRALGRVFRARLELPARVGERAELSFALEAGAPSRPSRSRAVTGLAAGADDLCVLRASGSIECKGRANVGLFERFADPFVGLSLGHGYGCAARASGGVSCWGSRLYGRTSRRGRVDDVSATDVPDVVDAVSVASGWYHACALRAGGGVSCWGRADHGELGAGVKKDALSAAPVAVVGVSDATAIAAGEGFTCALRKDGRVLCWGDNTLGQLGDGTDRERAAPVLAVGLDDATAIAVGRRHACALRQHGALVCWGLNDEGQLGDGSWRSHAKPTLVRGLAGAVYVAAGKQNTCAITAGGAVWCWGAGDDGQLGGKRTRSLVPVQASLAGAARGITVGDAFACAVAASDEPTCWGAAPRR